MKKKFMIIVPVLIFIVAGLIYYFSSSIKLVPSIFIKGAVVTEKGTVIENVINSSAGQPMFLKVKKEGGIFNGSEIKVIYHADNTPCVKDAIYIKAGENVEIHGVAIADDTISTCGSSDYYILPITSGLTEHMNNSVDNLVTILSSNPLWQNGVSPTIDLPPTASTEQVIAKYFESVSFDEGKVSSTNILEIRNVQIRGSLPDSYTAVRVSTNLGEKIVLLQYSGKMWWSKVYDKAYYSK